MTDQDDNPYKTIVIGNKTWMAENLRTTIYLNGDLIPYISGKKSWNVTSGAYCVYDDDNAYSNVYELLYNWYAIEDSRNIAPEGWHVATDARRLRSSSYSFYQEKYINSSWNERPLSD